MANPIKSWLLKRRVINSLDQLIYTLKFESHLSSADLHQRVNRKAETMTAIARLEEEIRLDAEKAVGMKAEDKQETTEQSANQTESKEDRLRRFRAELTSQDLEIQQARLRNKQVMDSLTEHSVKVSLLKSYRG